ncbi:hypothetical protein CTAYLR_008247 [Chrysophaeum taylorii]|uniref:Uncharacterized protein n=1 Tax=Chrysophaeum taylorii TaxID=2483200 RepID=A0AAD7UJ81_9STRA|nr:hypothetical protein CTAYLR_008247 [Chrysophaeum taylorii]
MSLSLASTPPLQLDMRTALLLWASSTAAAALSATAFPQGKALSPGFYPAASAAVVGPPPAVPKVTTTRLKSATCGECDSWSPFSEQCKPCEDGSVRVNGQLVTPKALREVEVMDAEGETRQLLSVVDDEAKNVVVFLRHLA